MKERELKTAQKFGILNKCQALEKDYQYYLYMGWKYPYFVRKIAEKCMGKNI